VALYERAAQLEPGSAEIQIKLADAAIDLGDASEKGLPWYERGERAAERAVALNEASADAHFLLAANRGHAANVRPILEVRPSIVGDLEKHLLRALVLNPDHARALHMMGVLLRDTPFLLRVYLVGKRSEVERYLTAAVRADPDFSEARLDLAELYRATGRPALARAQAQAVVDMAPPERARRWREKYRPAAEALLKRLSAGVR
jgi:tetratricopeptide (TPR) repeat protein